MSKKFTNTDIITTGSVQAADIVGGTVTTPGGGALLLGNTVTGGTLTDGTATLSGGLLTANEVRVANSDTIISENGIYCVDPVRSNEFRPYSGKSITLTSVDSPDTDPFIVKIKRDSQASCALELSEENASTGAIAGIRLSYQGDTAEDLDVDAEVGNFSALQIINRQDTDSIFNAYDILRSNSTATNVELLSEGDIAISAGQGGTVTLADNTEVTSAGITTGSASANTVTTSIVVSGQVSCVASNGSSGLLSCIQLVVDGVEFSNNFSATHSYLSSDTVTLGSAVELSSGLIHTSSSINSKSVVGIVASCEPVEGEVITSLGEVTAREGQFRVRVIAAGDTRHMECQGFNVCNENGDIQPGDLLVTSSTPGYLMKQDDDIIRSKTVGKAMEAVTFDANGQATGVYGFIYCG